MSGRTQPPPGPAARGTQPGTGLCCCHRLRARLRGPQGPARGHTGRRGDPRLGGNAESLLFLSVGHSVFLERLRPLSSLKAWGSWPSPGIQASPECSSTHWQQGALGAELDTGGPPVLGAAAVYPKVFPTVGELGSEGHWESAPDQPATAYSQARAGSLAWAVLSWAPHSQGDVALGLSVTLPGFRVTRRQGWKRAPQWPQGILTEPSLETP